MTNPPPHLRVAVAMLALMLAAGTAQAFEFNCPAQLHTEQKATAVEAGWEAVARFVDETPNVFSGIQFYEQHPSKMGSLVPDRSLEQKGKSVNVWKFDPRQSSDMWFACTYTQTVVILARRLPPGIRECKVVYQKGYGAVENVACH